MLPDDARRVPRLSVVLPSYRSQATLGRCLESLLAQDHRSYEVLVVDSSPDEESAAVVRRFPGVTLVRSARRLLPHAARNEGVRRARGELLVFTDPDIYAPPGWLRALEAAHGASGGVVVGALACHGDRWLDRGIHLVKFSKWLRVARAREVDAAPTANMLLPRGLFAALDGFADDEMLGDASFSWRLRERGERLLLHPGTEVEHHHLDGLGAFLRERYRRGILYGDLRLAHAERRQPLPRLLATPLRVGSNVLHTARHAASAGALGTFLATFPLVLAGHASSLAGEAVAYARAMTASPPSSSLRGACSS